MTRLLGICSGYDGRRPSEATLLAWHTALSDVDYDAAVRAVHAWYRSEDRPIMPAAIRRHVAGSVIDKLPSSRPLAENLDRIERELAADRITDPAELASGKARVQAILEQVGRRLALPPVDPDGSEGQDPETERAASPTHQDGGSGPRSDHMAGGTGRS